MVSAVVALVALGVVVTACSDSDGQSTLRGPPLTPAAQAWVTSVRTTLPLLLCDHDFFKECFDTSAETCRREATRQFDECANENREAIPDVPTPVSGKQAGRVIGSCVGRRLELSLKQSGQFRNNDRCNNPNNWLK